MRGGEGRGGEGRGGEGRGGEGRGGEGRLQSDFWLVVHSLIYFPPLFVREVNTNYTTGVNCTEYRGVRDVYEVFAAVRMSQSVEDVRNLIVHDGQRKCLADEDVVAGHTNAWRNDAVVVQFTVVAHFHT